MKEKGSRSQRRVQAGGRSSNFKGKAIGSVRLPKEARSSPSFLPPSLPFLVSSNSSLPRCTRAHNLKVADSTESLDLSLNPSRRLTPGGQGGRRWTPIRLQRRPLRTDSSFWAEVTGEAFKGGRREARTSRSCTQNVDPTKLTSALSSTPRPRSPFALTRLSSLPFSARPCSRAAPNEHHLHLHHRRFLPSGPICLALSSVHFAC